MSFLSIKAQSKPATYSEGLMTTNQEVEPESQMFSDKLCARCLKLQSFISNNREAFREPYSPVRNLNYSDKFWLSVLDQETCGICQVIYKATEQEGTRSLDETWTLRVINWRDILASEAVLQELESIYEDMFIITITY